MKGHTGRRGSVALWTGLFALLTAGAAKAQPIEVTNSGATQEISWTDAEGKPRSVRIPNDNIAISRYEYVLDEPIVDTATPGQGIGRMVHHGGCFATTSNAAKSVERTLALDGDHHTIVRTTFRLATCDDPNVDWRITADYLFQTGKDEFIQTVAYDLSDLPAGRTINDDMRGPYSQTDWPKSNRISGMGWGTQFKFRTTSPLPAQGDAWSYGGVRVDWEWDKPNRIPYVWAWVDPQLGNIDREMGVVQNQSYDEQSFGGGFYAGDGKTWDQAPPTSGSTLPEVWSLPTQMAGYDSNYHSGRITWGAPYGVFNNNHSNDTGTIPDMGANFFPVNAWSWTHVVGKYTERRLERVVQDTEAIYDTELTASVGQVITEGPRGAGDFVGPTLGEMPTIAYAVPGYDFVYRTWNVEAASNEVQAKLSIDGQGLERPTFVFHNVDEHAATSPALWIDGAALTPDRDFYSSYSKSEQKLWVTFNGVLSRGEHTMSVTASPAPGTPRTSQDEPRSDSNSHSKSPASPTTSCNLMKKEGEKQPPAALAALLLGVWVGTRRRWRKRR